MVTERPALPAAVLDSRVLVIVRGLPPSRIVAVGRALADGGVRAIEVTANSPEATKSIALLRETLGSDVTIGAGTVMSHAAAIALLDAGAQFLVTPHTDPTVVTEFSRRGVPTLVGALSPTEIVTAWNAGAAAVKLFPAGNLGPRYLNAVREPLNDIPFVPTGGVDAANVDEWLDAGAVAVAAGAGVIGDGEPAGVRARARELVSAAATAPITDPCSESRTTT